MGKSNVREAYREQPAGERRMEAEQEYIPEQPVERKDFNDSDRVDQDGRHRYRPRVLIDTC